MKETGSNVIQRTGGDAERLYQRLGWVRVGAVPEFALYPDGGFCRATYFYKRLART